MSMLLAQNNDLNIPSKSLQTGSFKLSDDSNNRLSTASFAPRRTSSEASAGLLFSTSQAPDRSYYSYFPSREECTFLYHQYFVAVDPLAHILHKPSFALDCYNLTSRFSGTQPTLSFKALLLSVYFAAAVSLSPLKCEMQLGIKQQLLETKLRAATEKALIDANYMSSVKLQTLQAFTIYMVKLLFDLA